MIKPFEYHGQWWLPNNPEYKFQGSVTYTPSKGISLLLNGEYRLIKSQDFDIPVPIIVGVTDSGLEITLIDCMMLTHWFNGEQRLYAYKAFVGKLYLAEGDILFDRINVHFANIEEWAAQNNFSYEWNDENDITIHYSPVLNGLHVMLNEFEHIDGFEISIDAGKFGVNSRPYRSMIIEQEIWTHFISKYPLSFDIYLPLLKHFQDFLSLSMSRSVFPVMIKGSIKNKVEQDDNHKPFEEVDIYYQISFNPEIDWDEYDYRMLFNLDGIKDRFENFVCHWYDIRDDYKPVLDLYISTIYNPNLYTENVFINYINALESFHRRKYGGKYQGDNEYRSGLYLKFLDVIPADLDDSFKQSLIRGKLFYANEYSLRKRLHDLIRKIPDDFPFDIVNNKQSREEFVENVCDIRNYLTHYGETKKYIPIQGNGFYYTIEKLKVLLEIHLLFELGFYFEEIGNMVFKYKRYRHVMNNKLEVDN